MAIECFVKDFKMHLSLLSDESVCLMKREMDEEGGEAFLYVSQKFLLYCSSVEKRGQEG